jgi:hypothetical protein
MPSSYTQKLLRNTRTGIDGIVKSCAFALDRNRHAKNRKTAIEDEKLASMVRDVDEHAGRTCIHDDDSHGTLLFTNEDIPDYEHSALHTLLERELDTPPSERRHGSMVSFVSSHLLYTRDSALAFQF